MLNKNFREFIELLNARGVEYLIVGGYAVGYYGHPRYTKDLDVFVALSRKNAERLVKVLKDFGFADNPPSVSSFLSPERIVEIGREPQKIQILTDIDGVAFDACFSSKVCVELDGLKVPFISFDDLMKNKKSTRRSKDRIDVIELLKIKAKRGTAKRRKAG